MLGRREAGPPPPLSPGSAFSGSRARRSDPPAPFSPLMSLKCLAWVPASPAPARRRDRARANPAPPAPRRAGGAARQRRTPGTARPPREGPCLSPPLQGASQNADPWAHLPDRNPGMCIFCRHARRPRTTTPGRQGWEFRAGLCISLESTVLVRLSSYIKTLPPHAP